VARAFMVEQQQHRRTTQYRGGAEAVVALNRPEGLEQVPAPQFPSLVAEANQVAALEERVDAFCVDGGCRSAATVCASNRKRATIDSSWRS